jgi:Family of unknown function (DUF6134)
VPSDEIREFEILVKDRPAGTKTVRVTETDNGVTTVRTDATVSLNYVLYGYRYEFHGQEVWQGKHLASVDDSAIDGGTKLTTRARDGIGNSIIETLGKSPATGPALSMTTNFWQAPEGPKGTALTLLDADQGSVHPARISEITLEGLEIAGSKIECTHYHLDCDLAADLWFDSQRRLVRQKTIEDGYPVEIRLTRRTTNPVSLSPR